MIDDRNQNQIIRKDARNCFVEILSDSFDIGKVHLIFATYDTSRPVGDRQTNNVNIYIDIPEFLELCRKLTSGELRRIVKYKKDNHDNSPIQEWLGGTTAEKLARHGKARADGMCVSRVARLIAGDKTDFVFFVDSGPGEQNEMGLIVPKFGRSPENHVVLSLSWNDFSELLLMTKAHYEAWLSASYVLRMHKTSK